MHLLSWCRSCGPSVACAAVRRRGRKRGVKRKGGPGRKAQQTAEKCRRRACRMLRMSGTMRRIMYCTCQGSGTGSVVSGKSALAQVDGGLVGGPRRTSLNHEVESGRRERHGRLNHVPGRSAWNLPLSKELLRRFSPLPSLREPFSMAGKRMSVEGLPGVFPAGNGSPEKRNTGSEQC